MIRSVEEQKQVESSMLNGERGMDLVILTGMRRSPKNRDEFVDGNDVPLTYT